MMRHLIWRWCVQVQNAVIAGRLKGHAGQYQAGRDKMMEAHAYEPWNTRILVDLAELCYAMKNYGVAVSRFPLCIVCACLQEYAPCYLAHPTTQDFLMP